jgi:lauroyl/myristoyl acyltransferase
MDHARNQMRHLLGESAPSDIDPLACAFIDHWTWCDELRWHPRTVTRQPVRGAENLTTALAAGRGVMLSFVHHGHFDGAFASVARATNVPVHALASAEAMRNGGPNMQQHLRVCGSGGGLVPSDSGTRGLIAELGAGKVVAAAIDVPGGSTVDFLGRTVRCSSGSVHAAIGAQAPVVVMTSHHDTSGSYLQLSEPLWPTDFSGADELLSTIARHQEQPLTDWPEATYLPMLVWQTATRSSDRSSA